MKKKERVLYKKLLIIFFLVLVIVLVRAVMSGFSALEQAEKKQTEQATEFAELDTRIEYLENRIEYLDTQEGLEQELLETFPIKRTGEQVTILIEQDEVTGGFIEVVDEKPWWKIWGE